MQLPDLPLQHPLAKDLQKAFRGVKGQRTEAGTEACRHDDCAVHAEGLQIVEACLRDRSPAPACAGGGLDQSLLYGRGKEGVDAPQRQIHFFSQHALGDVRVLQKLPEKKSSPVHSSVSRITA